MRQLAMLLSILAAPALAAPALAAPALSHPPHNVVLFVADGLRPGMIRPQTAPTMAAMMDNGVRFTNTHSLFPTFTMANGSALATGHMLGDTGVFSNTLASSFPVAAAKGSVTPFIENDAVLGQLDEHFAGDFLVERTVLAAAREAGMGTAAIGKLGPTLLQDHTDRAGQPTVVIDDVTGSPIGIPLSDELKAALVAANLPVVSPTRGENGKPGTSTQAGTAAANVEQQRFFADAATKAVLPMLVGAGHPFAMVFWSRDPDGTQHNQGDSLLQLSPGINGPTSLAAIRNADDNLAQILAALRELGVAGQTDVVVVSDHGFSTISKQSRTSFAGRQTTAGVPTGFLPKGFVATDLAHALDKKLYDPDQAGIEILPGQAPQFGNGLLGDPANPDVMVAANGGSDLIYVPSHDRAVVERVVAALSAQDYTSGLFVDDALGPIAGALPLSVIGLKGDAATPTPSVVINFASFALGCDAPLTCGVEVADSGLQQGQGMHGSFSRADTASTLIAIGPDFQSGTRDTMPASNADVGRTLLHLLGLAPRDHGTLVGRVLDEALVGGAPAGAVGRAVIASVPDALGHVTVLHQQTVGSTRYFDVAGYPGRTLGLPFGGLPFGGLPQGGLGDD